MTHLVRLLLMVALSAAILWLARRAGRPGTACPPSPSTTPHRSATSRTAGRIPPVPRWSGVDPTVPSTGSHPAATLHGPVSRPATGVLTDA